ncbi:MAG TPA: GTP-binding protein [Elusimicrobiota bacterium]|nr:GTP-binding protein [Elusimicrobiota bacterium]
MDAKTAAARESLRVVVTGHVDHGKSTVVGRLLADTGALPKGKLERVRAYCERHGKPFEYAFLLDALKDEQAQGITIESSRIFFKSARRDYVLVDAPGHVEFIKNMISGATQASAALLVLDAKEGVQENSRRHGYLLSMLGARRIAVLVNKMDLVDWREDAFKRLAAEYGAFLERIGARAERFIPVSGLHGDNLAAPSARMPWYRGPTALAALDAFAPEPSLAARPFRMPVQGVYQFDGDARRVVAGTVESGTLAAGDEAVFYPSGKTGVVRSIEEFPRPPKGGRVFAGSATGFSLVQPVYVRRGEIAARRGEKPPAVAARFRARLVWLGRAPLSPRKDYVLKLGTARVGVRLESVARALDASSLKADRRATSVARHEVADCVLRTAGVIAFDPVEENAACGRFVIVDGFDVCGGGLIQEALPDASSLRHEKVLARNLKWQESAISPEKREARYGQKAALVLITGARGSRRKEAAKELEARLFAAGRHVYFLGIGSALYGVNADLRAAGDHVEDIRRVAEVAHILMDSGLVLIVSASELTEEDLVLFRSAIDPDRIETFWVGSPPAGLKGKVVAVPGKTGPAVAAMRKRLADRGFYP